MQPRRAGEQTRGEQVRFHLLHKADCQQCPQRCRPAALQRQQHRRNARNERPDVRNQLHHAHEQPQQQRAGRTREQQRKGGHGGDEQRENQLSAQVQGGFAAHFTGGTDAARTVFDGQNQRQQETKALAVTQKVKRQQRCKQPLADAPGQAANPADERCGKLPRGSADAREQLRLHVAEGDTARFERSTPSGEQLPQAVQQRGQARHELRTLPQEGRNQPPEHSQHCAEQCQQGNRRRRAAGQPLFQYFAQRQGQQRQNARDCQQRQHRHDQRPECDHQCDRARD